MVQAYVTNASIALLTLGDSALSIPIEKREKIYESDSLSQPNSRSVGIGTALLLLCAHSIHPSSLLLRPFVPSRTRITPVLMPSLTAAEHRPVLIYDHPTLLPISLDAENFLGA